MGIPKRHVAPGKELLGRLLSQNEHLIRGG